VTSLECQRVSAVDPRFESIEAITLLASILMVSQLSRQLAPADALLDVLHLQFSVRISS
jgi:hypothetical protein